MATTPTTNFSWGKPEVGGDNNVWGAELNAIFDAQDSDLETVATNATAAAASATTAQSTATAASTAAAAAADSASANATAITALAAEVAGLGGGGTGTIGNFAVGVKGLENAGNWAGSIAVDMGVAEAFHAALTGDIVLSLINVPAVMMPNGWTGLLHFHFTASATRSITWPAGFTVGDNLGSAFAAGIGIGRISSMTGADALLSFRTWDSGTTWHCITALPA